MSDTNKSLAQLKEGEIGTIEGFNNEQISLKLLEMGCLPGCEVRMKYKAPLGDPICVCVCGYDLSLRLDEAAVIQLRNKNKC